MFRRVQNFFFIFYRPVLTTHPLTLFALTPTSGTRGGCNESSIVGQITYIGQRLFLRSLRVKELLPPANRFGVKVQPGVWQSEVRILMNPGAIYCFHRPFCIRKQRWRSIHIQISPTTNNQGWHRVAGVVFTNRTMLPILISPLMLKPW